MEPDAADKPIRILLYDPTGQYLHPLDQALAVGQVVALLRHVTSAAEFTTALIEPVEVILAAYPVADQAREAIQQLRLDTAFIVLCDEAEFAGGFSLYSAIGERIDDVLSINCLNRLPFVIRRELRLRQMQHAPSANRQNEARFRTIVEGIADPLLILDRYQVVRYVNPALESLLGYSLRDTLGRPFTAMLPASERAGVERFLSQLLAAPGAHRLLEHLMQRANDGAEVVETTVHSLLDPQGQPLLVLHVRSITERRLAESAVQRYALRMEVLHKIDLALIEGESIQHQLDATVAHIQEIIPCQQVGVILFDQLSGGSASLTGNLSFPADLLISNHYAALANFLEEFGDENIIVVEDIQSSSTLYTLDQGAGFAGMRSSLHVLLTAKKNPVGALVLRSSAPGFFKKEYQEIATEIGSQLSIAIYQHLLNLTLARDVEVLRETRQFLENTLNVFPANAAVLAPDGTILVVNLPWVRFANENDGGDPKGYRGLNYLTISDNATGPHSVEAQQAAAGIRAVITAKQSEFVMEYPCDSPTQARWFLMRVTPFAEPAPRRVVVSHFDISARKAVEDAEREQRIFAEALRDSLATLTASLDVEAALRQILAHSAAVVPSDAGAIILFDRGQGRIAYMRGHSPETEAFFQSNTMPSNLGGLDIDVIQERRVSYLAADTRQHPDWHVYPSTEWVRSSIGVPIIVGDTAIGLLTADSAIANRFQQKDVAILQTFARYASLALESAQYTEDLDRKVTERTAELKAAKERVEAILNNNVDGILLLDSDLRIQQANAAFTQLFQSEANTFVKRSLLEIVSDPSADRIRSAVQTVVEANPSIRLEVQGKRHDGTTFDAELGIGLVRGDGLVCAVHDISHQKQAEFALRQALDKEKELNELKSRFVSMASHEFRTPLATILAAAETLATYRDRMDNNQISGRLDKIRGQVNHLKDIIEDVLLLSRFQAGRAEYHPEQADLDSFCREIIEEFESQPQYQERLRYTGPAVPAHMYYDVRLMRHVINNLLSNALKYSLDGLPVEVTLTCKPDQTVLVVSDHGIGIPENDLKRLFEPFHRASNVGTISGTGLGLTITKQSVEAQGGTIAVESQLGFGTTFTVSFPSAIEPSAIA